jgi:cell wall-associated NlpC family hydrolase
MKLKFAAIITSILMLSICTTPIKAAEASTTRFSVLPTTKKEISVLSMRGIAIHSNANKIKNALSKLQKTVGKTWYVFSGETPAGWDCSGLTRWFYKQVGINLEHRASRQAKAGKITKDPQPGDIVAFRYKGYEDAYHVGIYIGNGLMIHAPKHGHLTRVEKISNFVNNYSSAMFIQILETV